VAGETQIPIDLDVDIVRARREGRTLAAELGFSAVDATLIATAISELARNILMYAQHGEIVLRRVEQDGRCGLVVVARDHGPGIADTGQALRDGFSTAGRLGLGLPGVRRLMDEFEIVSGRGNGTEVTASKWRAGR
jgi:serine/threonine-protein kinase RsbT